VIQGGGLSTVWLVVFVVGSSLVAGLLAYLFAHWATKKWGLLLHANSLAVAGIFAATVRAYSKNLD
jgi:hypothetical protein